jgi:hypothetical protein
MKKRIFLLVFVTVLLLLLVVGFNIEACASTSDVASVPSWIKVGTYAEYNWTDLSDPYENYVWKWEIISVSDTIQVLHHLVGNLTVGGETLPSTYMATINATTRGITNVTSIDKELPQGHMAPFPTIFSLWIPTNVEINENVSVIGPYSSGYPPLPVLRFENVDSPLETQECVVIGVEVEQGYPETDLFWYNTYTNVLVKYYMNWSMYDAESVIMLKQWVPIREFNFTFGENTYNVVTSSNSTIENFNLNQAQKQISFNVTGPTGTTGFCNVTIPDDLLWGEFSVYIDGSPLVQDVDYTQTYNGTHHTFYITYNHSTHTIEIIGTNVIPEFPTWTSILLILIVLTVAIVVYKRRLLKAPVN